MKHTAEKVEHSGRVMAIVLRKGLEIEGIKFFTPDSYPFQLGVMVHEAGGEIKPHVHKPARRVINETQEMIRVDFGKVDVDFYTDDGEKVRTVRLSEGDTILFVSGGHGFRFPEKARMTEVKQGPYGGKDEDKMVFA